MIRFQRNGEGSDVRSGLRDAAANSDFAGSQLVEHRYVVGDWIGLQFTHSR